MAKDMEKMAVNAIRVLSADAIQKANSGHPGLPLGVAPMAYEMWAHYLNINPADPTWEDRDRFILSGGHGLSGRPENTVFLKCGEGGESGRNLQST